VVRVGISGLGSIGRRFLRMACESKDVEVVAINELGSLSVYAHLVKYDSTYGVYPHDVKAGDGQLVIDGRPIPYRQIKTPEEIGWDKLGAEYVLECTGKFMKPEDAARRLAGGAKRVIISAPAKGPGAPTVILGVNPDAYDPGRDRVVSMGSCTTNCLVPVLSVLETEFGVAEAMMTTVHSYTNDQNVLDKEHKDPRRARAAGVSIIPTSTGASQAVGQVWPELGRHISGISLRVPTPAVSVIDVVARLRREASAEQVNAALREASEGRLKGILAYSEEPLVSVDLKGSTASATVDALSTAVAGSLSKVLAWYDNEWGYTTRLLDFVRVMADREPA